MTPILLNPRFRELVQQAEEIDRLRADAVQRGEATDRLDPALDAVLRDLGHHVLALDRDARARDAEDDPTAERTSTETARADGFTNEVEARSLEEIDDSWYTDEVTGTSRPRLFGPHEIESAVDDVPDSDPMPDLDDTEYPENDDSVGAPVTLAAALATFRGAAPAPLDELIRLLPALGDDPPADELSVEASRVQWACSDLDRRLVGLDPVWTAAATAWLSARARDLMDRLDVDVGPRTALDRLRRWHMAHGVGRVAGLAEPAVPETGSWASDARGWQRVLAGS